MTAGSDEKWNIGHRFGIITSLFWSWNVNWNSTVIQSRIISQTDRLVVDLSTTCNRKQMKIVLIWGKKCRYSVLDKRWNTLQFSQNNTDQVIYMGWCKKDVTPLLAHCSYVFLALTHWYVRCSCLLVVTVSTYPGLQLRSGHDGISAWTGVMRGDKLDRCCFLCHNGRWDAQWQYDSSSDECLYSATKCLISGNMGSL